MSLRAVPSWTHICRDIVFRNLSTAAAACRPASPTCPQLAGLRTRCGACPGVPRRAPNSLDQPGPVSPTTTAHRLEGYGGGGAVGVRGDFGQQACNPVRVLMSWAYPSASDLDCVVCCGPAALSAKIQPENVTRFFVFLISASIAIAEICGGNSTLSFLIIPECKSI